MDVGFSIQFSHLYSTLLHVVMDCSAVSLREVVIARQSDYAFLLDAQHRQSPS